MIDNKVIESVLHSSLSRALIVAVVTALFLSLPASSATAASLVPAKNEKARLKACERRLCRIIVGKKPAGPDLNCKLSKTWGKSVLKKGGKKSRIAWVFGDARCEADVILRRSVIIGALTGGKYKMRVPPHTVNCTVERSNELRPVKILIAPKIEFKRGKAKKIWLNVRKIQGPGDVKGLIWGVAKLEDSLGIFHKSMIKQVNKFIHTKCVKVLRRSKSAKSH